MKTKQFETKQLTVAIDIHNMEKKYYIMEVNGDQQLLILLLCSTAD